MSTNSEFEFSEDEIKEWQDEDDETSPEELSVKSPIESISQKYSRSQLRVVRETKDFTLDYLSNALKRDSFIINVSPEYQRRQRWSQKKRSQLIESFLMNIPIPPVFLFEHEYNEYEVVDGRQRLDTLRGFLENGFALTGLEYWNELNGHRYNELPDIIKKGLLRRSLPAIVLLAETRSPEDDDFDVRRVLFDRLNTGGEKLSPQELRNALYPGSFNKMLIQIARMDEFTSTWGIPQKTDEENESIPEKLANNTLYKTMADCELTLRFFAIKDMIEDDSRGSLRRLLDQCMKRHAKDGEKKVAQLQKRYTRILKMLYQTFDGKPFRIPNINRPSRSLYDAMMVASSIFEATDLVSNKVEIQARLSNALSNPDQYALIVGRKGNSVENIKKRVLLAATILLGDVYDERLA